MVGKQFWEKLPVDSADTLCMKNFVEILLSRSVSEINVFYAEIQDGRQKWWENVLLQKAASRICRYPVGQKFCRNRSVSEINAFSVLCKFKMATKSIQ